MGHGYAEQMLCANEVWIVSREGIPYMGLISRAKAIRFVAGGRAVVQGMNRIRMLWGQDEFLRYIRERDGFICTYCGRFGNTVDHVWPRSRGGICTPANCVCACRECNGLKAALSVEEFLAMIGGMKCSCYTYMNGMTRVCLKHRVLERAPRFSLLAGNLVQNRSV